MSGRLAPHDEADLRAALDTAPRAALGDFPTPVERAGLDAGGARVALWLKRDDLSARALGGAKVRALEFLLAPVHAGDTVLTVGGRGSTHVLATAVHTARLGARTVAIRWPHEMQPVAERVSARAASLATVFDAGGIAPALLRAAAWRARPRVRWVPFGGTSPSGMLGYVRAGLELADQVRAGLLPAPRRIVVPCGTGGTAAGLALGCRLAGLDVTVVAARVGPRAFVTLARLQWLAWRARHRLERLVRRPLPALSAEAIVMVHDVYGGAYGRPLAAGEAAARLFHDTLGVRLDPTYSAKAAAAALTSAGAADGPTLLWLTFDGRWLDIA